MGEAGFKLLSGTGPFYFIPDWDDYVDPHYDFLSDEQRSRKWEEQAYAHQLLGHQPSDGLLVSRAVIEGSRRRRERLATLGVHGMLRVDGDFPIMGDCGAFDYITEKEPRYTPEDVADYYTVHGFDFGVSVDHLIPTPDHPDREYRYHVTIANAERFMKIWERSRPPWVPVGAVQGWDPESYAAAARRIHEMGYPLLGIGGLVRKSTREIVRILEAIHAEVPQARLHLFGVARESMFGDLVRLGVFSVDSASPLRKAWLSATDNYLAPDGTWYTAIRVPAARSNRGRGRRLDASVGDLEDKVLDTLRKYDKGEARLDEVLSLLAEYESLHSPGTDRTEAYRRTLRDMPWKMCGCAICRSAGIEVIIFRGNNRNRRRGFHNTHVFYARWKELRESAAGRLPPSDA